MRCDDCPAYAAWMDELPDDWAIGNIGRMAYLKARVGWQNLRSEEFVDVGPFCVTGTDFSSGRIHWRSCYHVSEDRYALDPYIQLRDGDLLVTKDGTIGKVAIVEKLPGPTTLNSGVFVVRPLASTFSNRYLYWVLSSSIFTNFVRYMANGTTINHLYQNVFVRFSFPLPPQHLQVAIADFLDRETARIDALIEKKRQLLELLEEKRLAVIAHAVTKGLDPTAPMKDSGIEWLGQIPEHWEAVALTRNIQKLEQGWSPQCEEREASEEEWGVLRSGCVNGGIFRPSDYKTLPHGIDPKPGLEIRPGDLLMCRASGSLGLIGSAALVTSCRPRLMFSDKTYRLAFTPTLVSSRFATYALAAKYMRDQILLSVSGADGLANNIPQALVRRYFLVRPPLEEQYSIADHLDKTLGLLTKASNKVTEAVTLLGEYRSALITNAVTGKIDVRGELGTEATA